MSIPKLLKLSKLPIIPYPPLNSQLFLLLVIEIEEKFALYVQLCHLLAE